MINSSEISNDDDAIDDVWNEYNHKKSTGKKTVNIKTVFLMMMIENR